MLSQELASEIESFYSDIRGNSPIFLNAEAGKLSEKEISRYLSGILYLVQHTPENLTAAKNQALARGENRLAAFFSTKLREEDGHDKWAEEDLDNIAKKFDSRVTAESSDHIRDLVIYTKKIIAQDPYLYVPYILFVEYFTVLAAPEWLPLLEDRCGIPQSMMSVVGNHAELDKFHVESGMREIDELVQPAYKADFIRTLRDSMAYFKAFYDEVGSIAN